MAVTADTIDKAEWRLCYESGPTNGNQPAQRRLLPWAKLRFGGPGEDEVYVVPLPTGLSGSAVFQAGQFYRVYEEVMPNAPFPIDRRAAGVSGIHFFSGI